MISRNGLIRAAFAILVVVTTTGTGCDRQHVSSVTFVVETLRPLSDSAIVYVAGDTGPLGFWEPDGQAMQRTDSNTWAVTAEFPNDTEVEFKFTRGTWETEAVSADGIVPSNHSVTVRTDTTVRYVVANWKDVIHAVEGQITGAVRYHEGLEGAGIRPRDVIVWLPPGYERSPDRHYPVLYMHDGQNIVDPRTSYTGIDWQVDEHVDSLSASGRMDEIIIVGVYNTPDRSEEYSDTELGRSYLKFLVDGLKPFIDRTYRTKPGREHTAIMGSSMGGLISFLAAWYHPDTFSKAACLSPYFPDGLPRGVARREWDISGLRIYLDNGGDELDTRLQEGIDRLLPVLHDRGFVEGQNLRWIKFEGASHNEAAWAQRVWQPLLFFFGK